MRVGGGACLIRMCHRAHRQRARCTLRDLGLRALPRRRLGVGHKGDRRRCLTLGLRRRQVPRHTRLRHITTNTLLPLPSEETRLAPLIQAPPTPITIITSGVQLLRDTSHHRLLLPPILPTTSSVHTATILTPTHPRPTSLPALPPPLPCRPTLLPPLTSRLLIRVPSTPSLVAAEV